MTKFRRADFAIDEGLADPVLAPALLAFRTSAAGLVGGAYRTGRLGIEAEDFVPAARDALALSRDDAARSDVARSFFREHFEPLVVIPPHAEGHEERFGFVTAYFEPVLEASLERTRRFAVPLYRRPPDLVTVDDVSRPPGMDASFRFARRTPSGLLEEYPDRATIEGGHLAGQGLEIAWVEDPVDAFFVHVQGSARLRLTDGSEMRVGYAGKSGHPFTAIGRVLVQTGELSLAEADMAGIRRWLTAHPDRRDWLLRQNRSFIFFDRTKIDDPALGPVGGAGVALTAGASIAVDGDLATYGVPYRLDAPDLDVGDGPLRRIMIAQDTGSAILGPARADLFLGSGEAAGEIAGSVRHKARVCVLVPRALARRLAS